MWYWLYSLALTAAAVAGAPYWIYKGLRERKYFENFLQRLSLRLPEVRLEARPVWIHAVSVGEVLAAKPLAAALAQARPDLPIVVSTVTLTGQALARRELASASAVFYFPFDWDWSVARFLRRLDPRAVVLMETELWPNFLKLCARRRITVLLANARLSDRSLRRFRRVPRLIRTMLGQITLIAAQTQHDRRRFLELGAEEGRARVTGNLKFDFPAQVAAQDVALVGAIRSRLAPGGTNPIIVVGSSMKGEERLFIDTFLTVRRALPEARMVLAPRHPERFDEVAGLLEQARIPFCRRSAPVLLLDTIGELRAVYVLASVAVIGGSFLPPHGGHNLLEPAALGRAIVFGPEMANFAEMARSFVREQAARQCPPESLARALLELLANPRARDLLGQRALLTFRQNQGATAATLDILLPRLT